MKTGHMEKRFIVGFIGVILSLTTLIAQEATKDIEHKIDEIISQLSLVEKVKMCHAQSKFSSPGVPRLGIPEIWMSDGPHGVRAEINWDDWGYAGWTNDSCTAFPALTCLAASFNPELSYSYGKAIGEEARFRKKDILLGPGVNIYRTPLNGRNFEYMGEDPYLASQLVVPYIKGVQENGVAACVKHFALNNQEKWRGHINVDLSDRALYEIYLPAFKAAVVEGQVWSIMGAYNQFRGQHCCHNELLLNKILKEDWAFDGVVVTDWGGTHDAKQAALFGLDIEMGTWTNGLTASAKFAYDEYFLANSFLKALQSGALPMSVVDDKVRRILRLMYRTTMNKTRPFGSLTNQDHFAVARKVAQEGIVLLKNEANFFPIDPIKKLTIAVIGENATRMMSIGGGSSELKTVHEISPLQGLKARYKNATILHSMGYSSGPSAYGKEIPSKLNQDSLKQAAIEIAKQADLVIYVGGLNKNHYQDCEAGDRQQYNLPFNQDDLIRELAMVNKNIGVLLVSGNAVEMPWLSNVKAIMQVWYLGSEAGNAIADVVSGDVNPSGKLPFSFPVKLADNGAHSFGEISYPGDSINQVYKEDILVGYRWHDTKNVKPQFAFGFGLSYSTFEIVSVRSDKSDYKKGDVVKLFIELKNKGEVDGEEVVQVYVNDVKSSVLRPLKELKGFKKMVVKAGNTTRFSIELPVSGFAFYNEKTSEWKIEAGEFNLMIGNSSDNIVKSINIKVK